MQMVPYTYANMSLQRGLVSRPSMETFNNGNSEVSRDKKRLHIKFTLKESKNSTHYPTNHKL